MRSRPGGPWAQLIAPRGDATRSSCSLLGGIASCATCLTRLVAGVNRHGRRRYRCPNARTCPARIQIGGDLLDGVVQQQLNAEFATGLVWIGQLRCTDELLSTLGDVGTAVRASAIYLCSSPSWLDHAVSPRSSSWRRS